MGEIHELFVFALSLVWFAGATNKMRCFKTRVLGRRLSNGKPQERLRFRDLRSKMLAFKKRIAIAFLRFKDFPRGQGLRSGPLRSKNAAFCVCVLKPTKLQPKNCHSANAPSSSSLPKNPRQHHSSRNHYPFQFDNPDIM